MSFKAWGGLISSDIIPHKGTRLYFPLRWHGEIRLSRFGFLTSTKLMANWFSCSCNHWKCLSTLFLAFFFHRCYAEVWDTKVALVKSEEKRSECLSHTSIVTVAVFSSVTRIFPWLPRVYVYNRDWFVCDVTTLFLFAIHHNMKDICESRRVWSQKVNGMLPCYTMGSFLIAWYLHFLWEGILKSLVHSDP
jgi:hypothetical protein